MTMHPSRLARVCALLNGERAKYAVERVLSALGQLPWGVANELTPAEVAAKPITIIGDDPLRSPEGIGPVGLCRGGRCQDECGKQGSDDGGRQDMASSAMGDGRR